MTPYYQDDAVTIYHADWRECLNKRVLAAEAVITDPPYGINLDTDYTRFKGHSPSRDWPEGVTGDDAPFNPEFWLGYPLVVLFGANYFAPCLPLGKWLVWNKRDEGPSRVLADGEMAWHNGPGKSVRVFNWFWVGCYRKGEMADPVLHPTQKPVPLMRWTIEELTQPSAVILDPFMGSGTTLLAAKQAGRRSIGIEIEERYCEIAAKRCAQEVLDFTPGLGEWAR